MPKFPKLKVEPPPSDAEQSKNFRKGNSEIGFRIKRGRMSFLSRKLLNALTYRAQSMGIGGKGLFSERFGSVVIPEGLMHQNYWWIEMKEVVKDASFNSRDTSTLKEYLEELQRVLVIRDTPSYYGSDQLLGSVKIINASGPDVKRGGRLLLGWQFPAETEAKVLAPDIYTRLSVYFQGLLRTEQSLVLYEICKRFATNPSALTARRHWHQWQEQLQGQEIDGVKPEYKYFKRTFLSTAIAEVNLVTDIEVELIEHKNGRSVEDLQFIVHRKAQQHLVLSDEPAIDGEVIAKLEELGLSTRDAEKLCGEFSYISIREALPIVHERLASKTLPPLESPAAYMKAALKGEYAKAAKVKPKPEQFLAKREATESVAVNAAAAKRVAEIQSLREQFDLLDETRKADLLAQFSTTLKAPLATTFAKSGIRTKLVEASFINWFTKLNLPTEAGGILAVEGLK